MGERNSTPVNKCRSLGLRRSIQRISTKTPLSDRKVELAETGANLSESANKIDLTSRSSTPGRLSLKDHSQNCKGKQLDFGGYPSKLEVENVQTSVNDLAKKYENMTEEELVSVTAERELLLQSLKQHAQRSMELGKLIQMWKGVLREAVDECTRMPGMPEDQEQILEMLKIPKELYTV